MSLRRAGGGYIPWPTITYSNKHCDTFLQRSYSILSGPKVRWSKCKLPCVFLSKADEDRHSQWIHGPKPKLQRSSAQVNKVVKRRRRCLSPEC
ncbi:unnamed protein product [Rotaria sp. Silwood2]|nr:unnamed protein product [Rotaria sp. Silwood2]CAF3241408.1 unnamed protein product [Rotaria sp. Silwood2]CAF3930153.1 unnamed protein product [Rotaria sp. Silwood2]CAF4285547.1 unnamed protein product [Rotaria sp. Silwood2]